MAGMCEACGYCNVCENASTKREKCSYFKTPEEIEKFRGLNKRSGKEISKAELYQQLRGLRAKQQSAANMGLFLLTEGLAIVALVISAFVFWNMEYCKRAVGAILGFVLLNQGIRLLKGISWAIKVLANHKKEPEQEPECQKGLCAFCGYRTVCADARENVKKCRMQQGDGEMKISIKKVYPELAEQPLTKDIRRKMMARQRDIDRKDAKLLLIATVIGACFAVICTFFYNAGYDVPNILVGAALLLPALGFVGIALYGVIRMIAVTIRDN